MGAGSRLGIVGVSSFWYSRLQDDGVVFDRWLVLSFILALYGTAYVFAFIIMVQHYRLPFDDAFNRCVWDLQKVAQKWHTTYQMVNLIIFVVLFLLLLSLNIAGGYLLLRYPAMLR